MEYHNIRIQIVQGIEIVDTLRQYSGNRRVILRTTINCCFYDTVLSEVKSYFLLV